MTKATPENKLASSAGPTRPRPARRRTCGRGASTTPRSWWSTRGARTSASRWGEFESFDAPRSRVLACLWLLL